MKRLVLVFTLTLSFSLQSNASREWLENSWLGDTVDSIRNMTKKPVQIGDLIVHEINYLKQSGIGDKIVEFLKADVAVDNLIRAEYGFRVKKGEIAKFKLCVLALSIASLDVDFAYREVAYTYCSKVALERPIVLEPRDIEAIHQLIPVNYIVDVLKGLRDEQDQMNHTETLFELCKKNPLGSTAFSSSSENEYYCTLNLGFRACNLLITFSYPEDMSVAEKRLKAFNFCKDNKRLPLTEQQKSDYTERLSNYMAGA